MKVTFRAHHALLYALAALNTQSALAGGQSIELLKNKSSRHLSGYVVAVGTGPVWARGGKTQTFYLQPDIQKTWDAQKTHHVLASGELFLGIQRPVSSLMLGQIGIAVAATTSTWLDGDIWEDADPEFNNFRYTYKINHTRVAIKAKLLADINDMVRPYVSASLGTAFNRAYDFTATPKIFEEVPAPPFSNNTKNTFTYTVGAGVQKAIDRHWQAGLGYAFSDWGKSQLNRAPGQTLNTGLSLSHLYTHEAQFYLSYVA
ncbi:outer membrane beta-barrel protein [Legionella israelensis]|uniref:outer membrane protein n=1 Tax=Legionella israelensis TaxID=454 RepID=UPI00117EC4CD|nr:outer membrane beta-barrel protein [Legionella israelensis]QDP71256.1 outer membrane beta-barrel protein [Legionella israelensis]